MTRIAFLLVLFACAGASAGEGQSLAPLRDPYVPPSVREQARPAPETSGSALRAQVERKLRDNFDKADTQRRGSITREEARTARLGFIAENFEAIDEAGSGRVTYDDVKRYLRSKGARNL